jgi:hypothetical protein
VFVVMENELFLGNIFRDLTGRKCDEVRIQR